MSNPSKVFECRWQPSRRLLAVYLAAQFCAVLALLIAAIPLWYSALGIVACLAHGAWVLPRQILQCNPSIYSGVRHDDDGWQLWSAAAGWQAVQLRPDSMALPPLIVLRFRLPGQWWVRSLCIAQDALPADAHRQLRVRLKFTRRRWVAPE